MKKRTIRSIEIDADKCTGCRSCELVCSAFHAEPKFSAVNSEKSRIRIFIDAQQDVFVPLIGGPFTEAECNSRYRIKVNGKTYGECSFCRASCPSRDLFKDPFSGVALKCDSCEELSDPRAPFCVSWCLTGALTYSERVEDFEAREEEVDETIEDL
jgi:benzoyl-CoA reductase subunit BamC